MILYCLKKQFLKSDNDNLALLPMNYSQTLSHRAVFQPTNNAMTNLMIKLTSVFVALLAITCMATGDVDLVKNGQAVSEIVLTADATPSAKYAANDLLTYIREISGVELALVSIPTPGVNHVFVGASKFTEAYGLKSDDLWGSAYRIVTGSDYVALLGNDIHRKGFPYTWRKLEEWQDFTGEFYTVPDISATMDRWQATMQMYSNDAAATWYAAAGLLEQLGVRWYMPYEHGTVVPKTKNISVAPQNMVRAPKFAIRHYYLNPSVEQLSWLKRLGYGNDVLISCGHTIYDIISHPEQQKAHPEYLAKCNGKIDPGYPVGRGRPKLTNPGLRDSSVKFIGKVFEAYPELEGFGIGMPDGFDEIDEEDAKLFPRGENYTDRFSVYIWNYWLDICKQVKKQNPGKFFTVMPYGPCEEPPEQLHMLPDNMAVQLVTASIPNQMSNPQRRKKVIDLYERWHQMTTSGKIWIWQHYLFYGNIANCPAFFTKELQKEMQYLNGKVMGKFIECPIRKGEFDYPGITHWFYYLQGKLFWEPDLDLNALLNEYYTLYFGPSAAEMKQFYEYAESVYMRPESRTVTAFAGFLKEKDIDHFFALLAAAREKAGKGSVYEYRIAMFENEMAPLKSLFAGLQRSGPEIRLSVANNKLTELDCDFSKDFWKEPATVLWMHDLISGDLPETNKTMVRMKIAPDNSEIYFAITCYESQMNSLAAKTMVHDDSSIFYDDAVEIYVETPQCSYVKLAFNANGVFFDIATDPVIASRDTLPLLWESGVKVHSKKYEDRWELEIILPTKDFADRSPSKQMPWGINVCRARHVRGLNHDVYAISPTGGGFAVMSKLANFYR